MEPLIPSPTKSHRRVKSPLWLRWLSILLRTLHLGSVILLGAAAHGAPVAASLAGAAVLVSGLLLLAAEVAGEQVVLSEAAGAAALFKLLPVAAVMALPEWRLPLFWFLVAWSSVFSHAPKSLRHWQVWDGTRRMR